MLWVRLLQGRKRIPYINELVQAVQNLYKIVMCRRGYPLSPRLTPRRKSRSEQHPYRMGNVTVSSLLLGLFFFGVVLVPGLEKRITTSRTKNSWNIRSGDERGSAREGERERERERGRERERERERERDCLVERNLHVPTLACGGNRAGRCTALQRGRWWAVVLMWFVFSSGDLLVSVSGSGKFEFLVLPLPHNLGTGGVRRLHGGPAAAASSGSRLRVRRAAPDPSGDAGAQRSRPNRRRQRHWRPF